jgi:hypothetical protein
MYVRRLFAIPAVSASPASPAIASFCDCRYLGWRGGCRGVSGGEPQPLSYWTSFGGYQWYPPVCVDHATYKLVVVKSPARARLGGAPELVENFLAPVVAKRVRSSSRGRLCD